MGTSVWSSVQVAMESALATAITVGAGGVTKANPGVMTYTGTDPSNGDYIKIVDAQGMYQLNNRVFRVANVNAGANTLELEGENTTAYDTMVSASAQVITFGTTFDSILSVNVSGGEAAFIDATTIHDNINQQLVGNFSPIVINADMIWDPTDAAFIAVKAASDNKLQKAFKYTFANATKWLFNGYVGMSGAPTGAAQEIVKTPLVITSTGRLTTYST